MPIDLTNYNRWEATPFEIPTAAIISESYTCNEPACNGCDEHGGASVVFTCADGVVTSCDMVYSNAEFEAEFPDEPYAGLGLLAVYQEWEIPGTNLGTECVTFEECECPAE